MTLPLPPAGQGATESPALARLSPDSFFRRLVTLNHLLGISHFLFLPGMLFNDAGQWWGMKKLRARPHEGIDIFLMQDVTTGVMNIMPQTLIPAILPGEPVHFHRDFLGETLYIRHPELRRENGVLHTLYGHMQPGSGGTCPCFINKGQRVGTISLPPEKTIVPAHLHISCAWIRNDQQVTELNWENMVPGDRIDFIDPLPFLLQ